MKTVLQCLEESLAGLSPTLIRIDDDSHLHAGHAGAREGGHYRLLIVSEAFGNKNPVARHKLVHAAVAHLMQNGVHALSIKALTPAEASSHQI